MQRKVLLLFLVVSVVSADFNKNSKSISSNKILMSRQIDIKKLNNGKLTRSIFGPSFQSRLQDYINCQIGVYRSYLKDNGIDELDPLNLPLNQTNFDLGIIKGFVELSELQLQGLSNIQVVEARMSPSIIPVGANIHVKVEWPSIKALGGYSSNISVMGRPLDFNGNTTASLKSLAFEINSRVSENFRNVKVRDLSIKPTLGNSEFNFGGLDLNQADLGRKLGSALSKLATFINNNSDFLDQLVSPYILDMVNEQIATNANKERASTCQIRLV